MNGSEIKQMSDGIFRRTHLSDGAKSFLPQGELRRRAERLEELGDNEPEASLVVALASELLTSWGRGLPQWIDAETRYLVVADVPEPALLRLPAILNLHKPHLRLHVARDPKAVKRVVLAQSRPEPWEGIVDAYALDEYLFVILGDMTIREFPKKRLPKINRVGKAMFEAFEIDDAGSFLHWVEGDVHLGPSQLLQAVDPMYLADVQIARYAREKVSSALTAMRTERGLRQVEITGLSERHVRRLEKEEVRLTVEAAKRFAEAFNQELPEFLMELGHRLSVLKG